MGNRFVLRFGGSDRAPLSAAVTIRWNQCEEEDERPAREKTLGLAFLNDRGSGSGIMNPKIAGT